MNRNAELVGVLEALYAPEPDLNRWAVNLCAASRPMFSRAIEMTISAVEYSTDEAYARLVLGATTDPLLLKPVFAGMQAFLRSMPPSAFRTLYFPGRPACSHSWLTPMLPPAVAESLRRMRESMGAKDAIGAMAYPRPHTAVVFSATLADLVTATSLELQILHRIAAHLDSAFRLRIQPEEVIAAVLGPDGSLLDLEPDVADERNAPDFASRVVRIERTRLRAHRAAPGALDEWTALVRGRYSLVPREDRDGKRYYVLVLNRPAAQAHAAFTPVESSVVQFAARGFTGKGIAYALGISQAAVSEALGRAAAKLGISSRVALVRIAAALFGRSPDRPMLEALSSAEREVLDLLCYGLSNEEIARRRGTSIRTVANQVGRILQKTGSPSRRALSARVFEPEPKK